MGEPSSCGEGPDDLEITSIGTLYRGPWDKKYWSCSRGKDRYPYPVGYHAVRIHAGSTYRIEIHEGLKGPLFVVTSTDGDSCTGQTPDIAWENFQKKSVPRVKNWHGKRFSCKIDGVEIFGFRNPFVQRLLRELVSNVNGMAERSLASSSFCNGALQLASEMRMQDSQVHPDLLPNLWKEHSGKRSIKNRSSRYFSKEARVKRICCQDLLNNVEGGASEQVGELCLHPKENSAVHIQEEHMSFSKEGSLATQVTSHHFNQPLNGSVAALNNETLCQADHEFQIDSNNIRVATSIENLFRYEDIRTSALQLSISAVVEEDCHLLAREELLMGSDHSDFFVEKHVMSHEQGKAIGRENDLPTYVENITFYSDKRLLDRLSDAELEQGNSLVAPKGNGGEILASERYSDVCVSDTCDTAKDEIASFALESNNERFLGMKSDPVPSEPMLRTSTSCALEVIPRSLPNEFVSKNKNCSSEGMHSMATETFTPVDAFSKGLIKDSLQDTGSSSSPGSEKIDLNLVGQELARSMMTFLLPRAVPLLKKTYVKRRRRYRNRESKCDPCANLAGANSAECNFKNDRLTDNMYQGKLVAGTLAPESEENILEHVIVPQKILGVDSLCEMTKIEPLVNSFMAVEPLNEGEILKDVKSIVPDSFEDDQCLCDVAIRRPSLSGSDEADAAPSVELKQVVDNSKLLVNDTGGNKESSSCLLGNDGCNEVVTLPKELDKGENSLSDSLASYVHPDKCIPLEEKFDDKCVDVGEKLSYSDPDNMHINGDCICNSEEEIFHFEGMPVHTSQHFEQDPPAPSPNYENMGNGEVVKTILTQSYSINGSPSKKPRSSSPHELVKLAVPATDSGDANLICQVSTLHIPQVGLDGKAVVNGEFNSSIFCMPNAVFSTRGPSSDSFKKGNLAHSPPSCGKCNTPLSESIICRNFNGNIGPNAYIAPLSSPTAENGQARNEGNDPIICTPVSKKVKLDKKHLLDAVENVSMSDSALFTVAADISENQVLVKNITEDMKPSNFIDSTVSCSEKKGMDAHSLPGEWRKELTTNDDYKNLFHNELYQGNRLNGFSTEEATSDKEFGGCLELVGCYLHPNPVLFIWLSSKEECFQICVLCGLFDGRDRNIFMYKVPIKELRGNCPSFLGYTSLLLPLLKDPCDGNVPFERSGIQFTPDGRSLVFLNTIKAPHCREQTIDCLCSTCKSDCGEENGVKVAYVNFGYLSPLAKLTTIERISCILVCEPNYLIAAEESGRLHVWIMNCTWSGNLEEFMLPNFDYISPVILELKRIPKCDSLIIGHNGICGFGLWDISKRSLLARFSSPGHTIFQILPISLFSQVHSKETVLASNNWLSEFGENPLLSSSGENIAVWLLVSAALDSEARHDQVKQTSTGQVGWWRLALLTKNMVIMGSMLDTRDCAVDASADYGVIGACDGLLYKWKLSTGKKLANLHPFKCGGISRVAIDAKSGALAVASDERKLLVYVQT